MAVIKEKFNFQNKIKYLISNPDVFFEKIKSEKSIKDAFLIDAIARAFIASLTYFFIFSIILIFARNYQDYFGPNSGFIIPLIIFGWFFIGIFKNFIVSGIIYLILKMYKITNAYQKTYNVYVYSSLPSLVISIIPYVGLLSWIYSYYLMITGMAKVHNISIGKSALACLLPILILILIVAVPVLWLIINFHLLNI